jgi:hypothetical protein
MIPMLVLMLFIKPIVLERVKNLTDERYDIGDEQEDLETRKSHQSQG